MTAPSPCCLTAGSCFERGHRDESQCEFGPKIDLFWVWTWAPRACERPSSTFRAGPWRMASRRSRRSIRDRPGPSKTRRSGGARPEWRWARPCRKQTRRPSRWRRSASIARPARWSPATWTGDRSVPPCSGWISDRSERPTPSAPPETPCSATSRAGFRPNGCCPRPSGSRLTSPRRIIRPGGSSNAPTG